MDSESLICDFLKAIDISSFISQCGIRTFDIGLSMLEFVAHSSTEIMYVVEGSGTLHGSSFETKLSKNDCFVVLTEGAHRYTISSNRKCMLAFIQLDFDRIAMNDASINIYSFIQPYFLNSITKGEFSGKGCIKLTDSQYSGVILKRIIHEIDSKQTNYEIMVKMLCCQLLIDLARSLEIKNMTNINIANSYINKTINFIEDSLPQAISVKSISESVHLSPYYLLHLFKAYTGRSLMEYVTERRIDKSKHLLKNTQEKISEIAEQVGIQRVHYFSTLFKKHTCMTPNEYRKKTFSEVSNLEKATGKIIIKVNCGGSEIEGLCADRPYSKGKWGYIGNTSTYFTNDLIKSSYGYTTGMRSLRYGGVFGYKFDVADGSYTVRLYFAEIFWTSVNMRKFKVKINGLAVMDEYDIYKDAGHNWIGTEKTFSGIKIYNGELSIEFLSIQNLAQINVIVVERES